MNLDLADFEARTAEAVRFFWNERAGATQRQALSGVTDQGGRAGVTGGKNMDGFVNLIAELVHANGLTNAEVHLTRRVTTLPGYFRPTKDWDIVVTLDGVLIAVIELKSQVGPSFGNNFNNRTEEAIGSAVDLQIASREGAFGDHAAPFLGWLTHVEDSIGSRRPVKSAEPHFPVMKGMGGLSYLGRYEALCRRLTSEKLYDAAALITSTREDGPEGYYSEQSEATSLKRFVALFSARIAAEAAMS